MVPDARIREDTMKRYLLICGIVAVLATVVMIPRLASPNFGLLDDGVTIHVSSYILQGFKVSDLGVIFRLESDRGRFRPLYWLYYAVPYSISGRSPFGFFVVQWLSLILTGIAICGAVGMATRDRLASVLSGIVYVLSPPVIESYYTLSKGEPPMVLWLVLSVFFLFGSINTLTSDRKQSHRLFAASALFLFIAYFTKETAHAMLVVSALWAISALWQDQISPNRNAFHIMCGYFVVNLILVGIYWGARTLFGVVGVSAGEDSGHYSFVLGTIYASLLRHVRWYIRDFAYLLPILAFLIGLMWIMRNSKPSYRRWIVLNCVFWLVGWTAIMLPWHSTLEYYLLPATLGVSGIAGIGLSEIVKHLCNPSRTIRTFAQIALSCVLVLGQFSIVNGFTNGRIQIAVDSSNTDLVDYLALKVPVNGTVLVNLPEPNEYVFEMGVHLAVLKQRQDIQVRYFNSLDLSADLGAFIVTPIMKNQPVPAVRIAVHEEGAKAWNSELQAKLGNKAKLVYQKAKRVPLIMVAVEKPVCPVLLRANAQDGVYCGVKRPAIDTRVFEYGWEAYTISYEEWQLKQDAALHPPLFLRDNFESLLAKQVKAVGDPPHLFIATDRPRYRLGDVLRLTADLVNPASLRVIDGYLALRGPDGRVSFYDGQGFSLYSRGPWVPLVKGFPLSKGYRIVGHSVLNTKLEELPSGLYTWYALLTESNTYNVIARAQATFTLEP